MSIIKFEDEKNLQRKICNILNKHNYAFKKEHDNYFCDIHDPLIKVYCEVKTNGKFAPQQLLYGIAKENIQDAKYLALANEYEIRIYIPPKFEDILTFAHRISKDLSVSPSSVISKKFMVEAFNILGDHLQIYNYIGDFKIDEKQPYIFLDNTNYEYFQLILSKYRIDPAKFINTFAKTWTTNSKLHIKNDNQTIVDLESNLEVKSGRKIMNKFDQILIQNTRIRAEDVEKIIHRIDELAPLDVRRKRGKYWSSTDVSSIATELIREYVNPTFVFEPFVGGGSLVRDLVDECDGIVNDIDKSSVDLLEQEWEGFDWKFHRANILTTPMEELHTWIPKLDEEDVFCIYTNPPFGTSCANALASKNKEKKNMIKKSTKSRKTKIQYGCNPKEAKYFGDTYGRGDLCIPSIAKMIEMIKHHKNGYLAFFSPFAVMLGRSKYNKILKALLKDFKFVHGEVFGGDMFNGVSKSKAISFTIWKYNKNCNTNHESLEFNYKERLYNLKFIPLLKDWWYYKGNDSIRRKTPLSENDICIFQNMTFTSPSPKIFTININTSNSGSYVIPDNIKIPLNNINIPDELIFALWSTCVGNRAIVKHIVIFDNCYTHLPDFTNEKTPEILSYAVISTLITELKNNYTEDKIGFVGMNRVFKFGGKSLTKGAQFLIDTYGDCKIGEYTITSIFNRLKHNENPDDIDKKLRILIKHEIELRLNQIGYWDYLPIPNINSNKKK